jgi:hypothetical protein
MAAMERTTMTTTIRVRDIVRAELHELGAEEHALRVPYDLFRPAGAVHRDGNTIEWEQDGEDQISRCAETALGECSPGERVLLRLSSADPTDEWWLCEVEAVDGVAGAA